jgi:uncharacterized membrane protein YkvA (DUF1232 family)
VRLDDIQAVIDSAKSRETDTLSRFIRRRLPEATEAEVTDASGLALEIIDSVPLFLARADQEAVERHLEAVVKPLLEHLERYFLQPMDLIPEMTHGLVGLLDDTYLVLRMLQNLDKGPDRFLDWELAEPLEFLRRLVGEEIARILDERALEAMQTIAFDVNRFVTEVTYRA